MPPKIKPKMLRVRVVPCKDPTLKRMVICQGTKSRQLPHDEVVEVPETSYYLRLLHQGAIELAEDTNG